MKQAILFLVLMMSLNLFAQEKSDSIVQGFGFVTLKKNAITPVKNQSSSGTCWCFSGLALVESELLRQGKGEYDFSEMFIVHKNYEDKAKKYVRMHGKTNFGGGGSFTDVIEAIRDYGLVPEKEMTGLQYGDTVHRHGELDALTSAYVNAVITNPNKKLSTVWFNGYNGILDAYLGKCPDSFIYNGKNYTPQSFASFLGINPDDYISITSFTHHPFYSQFAIEVEDNWRWALSYNLPLDEMIQIINNAVENGYCIAWASDVSEKGFSRKGIAVVPDLNAKEGPGSDQVRWLGLTPKEREGTLLNLREPVPQLKVTQEMRQEAFDNYQTTDDHGMLIYGTAKDKNGTPYFLVKNSWGTDNPYEGTWYASEEFVKYKTTNIVIHKNAIPRQIMQKLSLK